MSNPRFRDGKRVVRISKAVLLCRYASCCVVNQTRMNGTGRPPLAQIMEEKVGGKLRRPAGFSPSP